MTPQQQIKVTPTTDEERAIATITMAFSSDAVTRRFLPDANQYLTYWRHGFEEIGVIQAGGSPPMWPMLRRVS